MKNKKIILTAVFTLSVLLFSFFAVSGTKAQGNQQQGVPDVKDLDIIAFGDSLVEGVGATDEGFVSVLEDWIDFSIKNEGNTGDTSQDGLGRLEEDVLNHDPDIVMVLFGGNDLFQGVPLEKTLDNLEEIITSIQEEGGLVILLGAHGESFIFDREEEYEELAEETNAYYVPNLLQGILGDPDLLSDPVHPNNQGYKVMAEKIFPVLQETIADTPTSGLSGTCEPDKTKVTFNETVTWSAHVVGGNSGNLSYDWLGSDDISGGGQTKEIGYDTEGTKVAAVEVSTNGENDKLFQCSPSVVVTPPALSGSCTFEIDVEDMEISWGADVSGGDGEYDYDWTGTGGLSATGPSVTHQYDTPGAKQAEVLISSGSQDITLPCRGEIPDKNDDQGFENLRIGCGVESAPFEIGEEIRWHIDVFGFDNEDVSVEWSGTDGLEGDDQEEMEAFHVYDSVGIKEAQANISIGDQTLRFMCSINVVEEVPDGDSGCFIATAAFGTPLAQEINHLRDFRDKKLITNSPGKTLVSLYYRFSPPVAEIISENYLLKEVTRNALRPIITIVK